MNVGGEQDHALGDRRQYHRNYKRGPTAISVRIRRQDEISDEHTDQIARADQPDVLLRLAQQIEFLDPVVDVFGVGLVESEQIFVQVQVILAYKLL